MLCIYVVYIKLKMYNLLFSVVGVGKTCTGSGNESRGSGRKSELRSRT